MNKITDLFKIKRNIRYIGTINDEIVKYDRKISFIEHVIRGTDIHEICKTYDYKEFKNKSKEHNHILIHIANYILEIIIFGYSKNIEAVDTKIKRIIWDKSTIWPHDIRINYNTKHRLYNLSTKTNIFIPSMFSKSANNEKIVYRLTHCIKVSREWKNITDGEIIIK